MEQVSALSSVSADNGNCAFTITYTSGDAERVLMNRGIAEQVVEQVQAFIAEVRSRYSELLPFGLKGRSPDAETLNSVVTGYRLLWQGDWAQGWKLHALRWVIGQTEGKRRCLQDPRFCQAAMWNGEPLRGKRILLFCEQGYGDGVQFIRFAGMLVEKGAYVMGYAPRSIAGLWKTAGMHEVVTGRVDADYRVSVMDLPFLLGITPENVPSAPYLSVPDGANFALQNQPTGKLKVGLVWAGNPKYGRDRDRSAPLPVFAPLFTLRNISWYSLQHGSGRHDLEAYGFRDTVEDIGERVLTWSDTTAAIAQMDLVISVDTAVAHVAGAMGKPVWLALDTEACWRWMTDKEETVWYPSMRLFRQTEAGNWARPIEKMKNELASKATQP